jgi:hypothetical protein
MRNNILLLGLSCNQGGTKKDTISREGLEVWRIRTPGSIRVSIELKRAGTREKQVSIDSAMKILKDTKEMVVVDTGENGHELTQDVDGIRNVRTSDTKIEKTTNEDEDYR